MKSKFYQIVVSSLLVAAVVAAAKSIVDVEVLKVKSTTNKELIIEIRKDVKWLRDNWGKR